MRRLIVPLTITCSVSLFSADGWIYLKEGRVGTGPLEGAPVRVVLPDGTEIKSPAEEIAERRAQEQVNQVVAKFIEDLARNKNVVLSTQNLQALKHSATEPLLQHLARDVAVIKICALYGLQFCWTEKALKPTLDSLSSTDKDVRRAALGALCTNVSAEKLAELMKPFLDSKDMELAGACFDCCERFAPDTSGARMLRLLKDATGRVHASKWISHYYSPEMTPPTLAMIDRTKPAGLPEQRAALVGLISQLAAGDAVRERAAAMLASPNAELRELAAEYFMWLGTADVEKVSSAAKREADIYAKASMEAAIKVIQVREAWRKSLPDGPAQIGASVTLADALNVVVASPRNADITAAQRLLSSVIFEPYARTGQTAQTPDETARTRALLIQKLLCAPSGPTEGHTEHTAATEYPAATKLLPPLRDYFDPKRKSYGLFMGQKQSIFDNSVHIGDDCGWQKELRTIVSIGPGLVRQVSYIPTWGHLVVIEHRFADGQRFCSLYGHLSPFLLVKPGDVVSAGQKIGSIGRQLSSDNGGYFAHLHFGIHSGPYSHAKEAGKEMSFRTPQGIVTGKVVESNADSVTIVTAENQRMTFDTRRWIAGYLSPEMYEKGLHAWQDPQAFLQKYK
ncbi:MAG TPA: M23 family metallopeptidase [Planctomycetota bacterium]|nr:M23 family metallopeptidase [Planctomycetota bacterium]